MPDARQITRTPFTATLGGQEFQFLPVGLDTLGRFESWIVDTRIQSFLRNCPSDMPADKMAEMVNSIARMVSDEDINAEYRKPSGIAYMIWLSVSPVMPHVKLAAIVDAMQNATAAEVKVINTRLMETVLGGAVAAVAEAGAPPPQA